MKTIYLVNKKLCHVLAHMLLAKVGGVGDNVYCFFVDYVKRLC